VDAKTTLKATLFVALENLGFDVNDALFDYYAESGKLVLLLDGFDELIEDQVVPVITQLENWAERYPTFQVIVSSRPGGEIQKSPHFSVVRLAPLGGDDHKPFLTKIGVRGKQLTNLLAAVDQSPSQVKEFLNTPLLLTLLTIVYQTDGTIPSELPEFFQVLFATVFSKHDGTKPGFKRPRRTELNDRSLQLLFESFCFSVLRRNYGVTLDEEQFVLAFEDATKFRPEHCCTHDAFRHDLVKVACLLLEDGYKLAFAHKSLLEYFCASFIGHATEKQAESIYSQINLQQQWRPTLQYASYIDKYKFSKYFAIPKLQQTFDDLDVKPDEISMATAELVLNKLFENARTHFHFNPESKKFKQGGLSSFKIGPTIYTEKIFFSTVRDSITLISEEYSEDELLSKFGSILEASNTEGNKEYSGRWFDFLSNEKKSDILNTIYATIISMSKQLYELIEYVKNEDEKASSLILNVA
jgi:hypothetical protein